MSDSVTHETLIARLSGELRPTRRLLAPWKRTLVWLVAVLALALYLGWNANLHGLVLRLGAAPDMWLSQLGAMLTAGLSAWAAFQTSIPGRSPRWALLPLPALVLWLAASTAGCLRLWPIPGTEPEPPGHDMLCLKFIVFISLPLAGLLTWRLTRACPLRPGLTSALAGLASAGAAASLLAIIHPFDASAADLLLHLLAVVIVVGLSRIVGNLLLQRGRKTLLF
jgi:hypothetical protein